MSFLSDRDIMSSIELGDIKIEPFRRDMVQPASVDLTLSRHFKVIAGVERTIDTKKPVVYASHESDDFLLGSLQFALASTTEKITLSDFIVGRLEGKSSLGRIGLTAHVTAGFFDPGFSGYATLELFNASLRPIRLYAGMKICQMSFAFLHRSAERPYGHPDLGSKYQNQSEAPEGTKYHQNF
jgi:dCTP deaminase